MHEEGVHLRRERLQTTELILSRRERHIGSCCSPLSSFTLAECLWESAVLPPVLQTVRQGTHTAPHSLLPGSLSPTCPTGRSICFLGVSVVASPGRSGLEGGSPAWCPARNSVTTTLRLPSAQQGWAPPQPHDHSMEPPGCPPTRHPGFPTGSAGSDFFQARETSPPPHCALGSQRQWAPHQPVPMCPQDEPRLSVGLSEWPALNGCPEQIQSCIARRAAVGTAGLLAAPSMFPCSRTLSGSSASLVQAVRSHSSLVSSRISPYGGQRL